MSDVQHRLLARTLHTVQGKVAVSGYHSKLMDALYGDWQCIEAPAKKAHSTNTGVDNEKQERADPVDILDAALQRAVASLGHSLACAPPSWKPTRPSSSPNRRGPSAGQ